jgi:hypothetical protein
MLCATSKEIHRGAANKEAGRCTDGKAMRIMTRIKSDDYAEVRTAMHVFKMGAEAL